MKESIFEWMNSYDGDIKVPDSYCTSEKRIKEIAMKKINSTTGKITMRRRIKKRTAGIAIAAVIAVIAGSSIFANESGSLSNSINFFKNMKDAKDGYAYTDSNKSINSDEIEILNSSLTNETSVAECNGTKIELLSSIADENVAYFFFKLTAPEGILLDHEDYEFREFQPELNDNHGPYSVCGGLDFDADDNLTDNVRYFTYTLSYSGDFYVSYIKTLKFANMQLPSSGRQPETELILSGAWEIPVELSTKKVPSYELIEEPIELSLGTLSSMRISPFSLNYNFSNIRNKIEFSIILKDGTTFENIIGSVGGDGQVVEEFTKPLDLSQVDYILVEGNQLKLPSFQQ